MRHSVRGARRRGCRARCRDRDSDAARRPAFDDLVQVGRVGKRPQRSGHWPSPAAAPAAEHRPQRRAELHAADPDARPLERDRAPMRIFELHREVTAVEAEADVFAQVPLGLRRADAQGRRQRRRADGQQPDARRTRSSRRCSRGAVGLRLDVEVDQRAAIAPQSDQRLGDARDVRRDRPPRLRVGAGHPGLVGQRRGRDAAVDALGQQPAQDLDQVERVADPRRIAPVRRVDVRLDRRAVKGAVRKAVDDRDVQPLAIEELAELGEPVAFEQLARLARREAQPEAERRRRREPRLQRRRVVPRGSRRPRPSRRPGGCWCSR